MGCMIEQPGFFPNMTVEQTLKYYCNPERDTGYRTDPGNDENDGNL